MKLLKIDSSARRSSVSRRLTAEFAEAWKRQHPDGEVIERDLTASTPPPITDEWMLASHANRATLSAEHRRALEVSDTLVEDIFSADTIVIGAPMYNYTISAPLKAWIDQIVRLDKTVQYTASGPKGLIAGKQVIVIESRGGAYREGTPAAQYDFQEPYLRHILGLLGITDLTFVRAENQLKPDLAESSRVKAAEHLNRLIEVPVA